MPSAANTTTVSPSTLEAAVNELIYIGKIFYDKNWSLATSSNYSIVMQRDPLLLLMTASGRDKGRLAAEDFVLINNEGAVECSVSGAEGLRPSAETLIHLQLCRDSSIGAVLHTHSIWSTLISAKYAKAGAVSIAGFEMLKAIAGVDTHESTVRVPVFGNDQDISRLADEVCAARPGLPGGFLIEKHGLYAFGVNIEEAKRHIEGFEFLFELAMRSEAQQWL